MNTRANQRLSNPNDARALRSREALRNAFLRLIGNKPLQEISMQDITEEAGVSYPTFFRHFESKENILKDIAKDEIQHLLSMTMPFFENEQREESLYAFCAYINSNRSLWTTLLTAGASTVMREEFILTAAEIAATREKKGARANPWLPIDLAGRFVVGGIFEILSWWLQQPESYPVKNVVTLLDVLVVRSTAQPVDVKLL